MKKRFLIVLLITVFMFGFTFAPDRFSHVSAPSVPPGITGTTPATITTVSNQAELFAAGQDTVGNATGVASASRKSLKFSDDVDAVGGLVLTDDLILTADVAIDLNGKTLNLNNHTLAIRHGYAGSVILTNGTVIRGSGENVAGTGRILLQTPRADAVFTGLTDAEGAYDFANSVTMATADKDAKTAAIAYEYVQDAIENGGCAGAYSTDIPLPVYFGTLGRLTYVTSDASVVNEVGRVTATAATDTTVTLTPTFLPTGGSAVAAGAAIAVRVIGSNNTAAWRTWLRDRVVVPALGITDGSTTAQIAFDINLPVTGYWNGELGYTLTVDGASVPMTTGGSDTKYATLLLDDIKSAAAGEGTLEVRYGGAVLGTYTLKFESAPTESDQVSEIIQKLFGISDVTKLEFSDVQSSPSGYTEYPMEQTQELLDTYKLTKVEVSVNFNFNNTFMVESPVPNAVVGAKFGTVKIVNKPQPDDSVTMTVRLTVDGVVQERTLALVYTGSTSSDTEANPTRFQTHYSYFDQQVRDGTHQKYDIDQSFGVSAMKTGSIPYVAFRLTDASGNTYDTTAAEGGVTLTLFSGGAHYTPVYSGGVFNGLTPAGGTTLSLKDSMAVFNADSKWVFTVDPAKRNRKTATGGSDVSLVLEYQYCFATDYTDATKNYWFVYTEEGGANKIVNDLSLLSLVMSGADDALYDFADVTAADRELYDKMKELVAPNYTYIPMRYLSAPRADLNVKALFFPDRNTADKITNGDVDASSGYELDSIRTAQSGGTPYYSFTHWNWLALLTGLESLNLHGMHITDAVLDGPILQLKDLTGLDVSGIFDPLHFSTNPSYGNPTGYNDDNKVVESATHSEYSTPITNEVDEPRLKNLCIALEKLTSLNLSYCKIFEFRELTYLSEAIRTVRLEGNQTWNGTGSARGIQLSGGSNGGRNALVEQVLAARGVAVYRRTDSDQPFKLEARNADTIKSVAELRAIVYPRQLPLPTPTGSQTLTEAKIEYLTATVLPRLPVFTPSGINAYYGTGDQSYMSYNMNSTGAEFKYTVTNENEILLTVKLASYIGQESASLIVSSRMKFEWV